MVVVLCVVALAEEQGFGGADSYAAAGLPLQATQTTSSARRAGVLPWFHDDILVLPDNVLPDLLVQQQYPQFGTHQDTKQLGLDCGCLIAG